MYLTYLRMIVSYLFYYLILYVCIVRLRTKPRNVNLNLVKLMKKLLSVLFLLSFTLASVYAQDIQVKGTVVSGSDNEPLPGVNVVVKGTTNGGITDLDGNFTLSVPADATLSVTYIGFKSQEVAVKGQRSLKIILQEDTETLDEVVVVGYGVQKKSVVTAAISKVGADELNLTKPSRVEDALKGKFLVCRSHNHPVSLILILRCVFVVLVRLIILIRYILWMACLSVVELII